MAVLFVTFLSATFDQLNVVVLLPYHCFDSDPIVLGGGAFAHSHYKTSFFINNTWSNKSKRDTKTHEIKGREESPMWHHCLKVPLSVHTEYIRTFCIPVKL